jgi:hypothetical protein
MHRRHRRDGACGHDRQKPVACTEAHHEPQKVDREEHVETDCLGIADQLPEDRTEQRIDDPWNIDNDAEARIPGEGNRQSALPALFGLCILRIHEQKEGDQLLSEAEMSDVLGEGSGIEHVAEVDRKDREHYEPGLHVASEEFDADHLACTRIDGGAHEHRIGNRKAVIHRKRAEKRSEGRRRQHDRKAAAQPFPEIASAHEILLRGRP